MGQKLTDTGRHVARLLQARHPALAQLAAFGDEERCPPAYEFYLLVPSPTGDARRQLGLWVQDGDPGLGFGDWHTYADLLAETTEAGIEPLLDLLDAILDDRFVLLVEDGSERTRVVDLREPDGLADELTGPWSPGAGIIISFGGTADRRVGLGDLAP